MPFYYASELSHKILKIYSKDITESSSDGLRLALGNYYKVESDPIDEEKREYDFPNVFVGGADDGSGTTTAYRPWESTTETLAGGTSVFTVKPDPEHTPIVEKIEVNPARITKVDKNAYVPNFKIPVRLYANRDAGTGDQFWNTFFMGGDYGGNTYPALFNSTAMFYDTELVFYHPYSWMESKRLYEQGSSYWAVSSQYNDYDEYVQNYHDWSKAQPHELMLPNYTFSISALFELEGYDEYSDSPAVKQRKILMDYYYPLGAPPFEYEKNRYFGYDWLVTEQDLELVQKAIHVQQNLFFDQDYYFVLGEEAADGMADDGFYYDESEIYAGLYDSDTVDTYRSKSANMYNITISFSRNETDKHVEVFDAEDEDYLAVAEYKIKSPRVTDFDLLSPSYHESHGGISTQPFIIRDLIENSNFSAKFLEILKDLDDGTIQSIPYSAVEYETGAQYLKDTGDTMPTGGTPTPVFTLREEVDTKRLRTFDWMNFLVYIYNNYDGALNDNYSFLGPVRGEHATTYADSTLYRFADSQNVLKVIDHTIDYMNQYFYELTEAEKSYAEGEIMDTTEGNTLSDIILNHIMAPVERFSEVLAYKVEKYTAADTGDTLEQDLIQKFWMFNSKKAPHQLRIKDSQVKYGKDYTYRGYAYVLVTSHKYKYSDFRLTKQIGVYDTDDDGTPDRYCFQFYDPTTNELAEQIFRFAPEEDLDSYSELLTSELAKVNTFATNGIDVSKHPQLADFHLNVEPCMKIIEVPIFEKTTRVHDNPPNGISVVPFHFLDDSKRIGFNIFSDGWKELTYPITITDKDASIKSSFLSDKDIMETEGIKKFSQSPARYIEIFRSTIRPTSFKDFNGKLVSRIDLRIQNEELNRKDFIASDEIHTNKKYYYVFRFVNENGLPGHPSSVIEAELNDDGGYIYSLFDIIDSSEFTQDPYTVNSTSFKKIFQLEPNMQHLIVDAKNANFSNFAKNEYDNVDVGTSNELIWGRKFKIRLISKKTGKKLDINVKYNLREKDLSPEISSMAPASDLEDGPTAPIGPMGTVDDDDGSVVDGLELGVDDDDGAVSG